MNDNPDDLFDEIEDDDIEAYCMACKQKTAIDNPEPIWTRRGAPGTRGTCPTCGTTVFRMGKTAAHARLKRPEPVHVAEAPRAKGGRRIITPVTYINYSVTDAEFAAVLSEDLSKIGIQTWLAEDDVTDVQWATGVHPALVECKQMIVVLSPLAAKATSVMAAWQFFLEARKPIVVVQFEPSDVPDELRTRPRFDFTGGDYKRAFRELAQVLNE